MKVTFCRFTICVRCKNRFFREIIRSWNEYPFTTFNIVWAMLIDLMHMHETRLGLISTLLRISNGEQIAQSILLGALYIAIKFRVYAYLNIRIQTYECIQNIMATTSITLILLEVFFLGIFGNYYAHIFGKE